MNTVSLRREARSELELVRQRPQLYHRRFIDSLFCQCLVCLAGIYIYFHVYTGPHLKVTDTGEFTCVVCGNQLFKTDTKYDSGSGWPSFYDVVSKSDSVVRIVDNSLGVVRVIVIN